MMEYNNFLTSLYNENGVLLINDTVYKILDDYIYIIPKGDINLIEKINNHKDLLKLNDVVSSQYVKYNVFNTEVAFSDENSNGIMKAFKEQTNVCNTSGVTRTFVVFEGEEVSLFNIGAVYNRLYVKYTLSARYQRKVLVWLTPAKCDLNRGKITLNGSVNGSSVNWNYTTYSDKEYVLAATILFEGVQQTNYPRLNYKVIFDYKKDCNEEIREYTVKTSNNSNPPIDPNPPILPPKL